MKLNKLLILSFLFIPLMAFTQTADDLLVKARDYNRLKDYNNAIIVYNKALEMQPDDVIIMKETAIAYYSNGDLKTAEKIIKPTLDKPDCDEGCYLIAANIEEALNGPKGAPKIYKKGLKKFPESATLYNRYGKLLYATQDVAAAVKQWEKGIIADPLFATNYFDAGKFYIMSKTENAWGLIYMEQFVNMQPKGFQINEAKYLLVMGYKKLFSLSNPSDPMYTNKSLFAIKILETIGKNGEVMNQGVTTESLTMLRTRFVLNWYNDYAEKYPFKLFDEWRAMLKEGVFEAYNQWIFATEDNLAAYNNWISKHQKQNAAFQKIVGNKVLKPILSQHYNK